MYNYRTGSTAGGYMGNSGALNPGNIFGGPQQGQENQFINPQLNPYMNQGYLPSMGMEAQQNPGPMPGMIGGMAGRAVGGMGNMGGLGIAGQIAGQFQDPMTIKRVY